MRRSAPQPAMRKTPKGGTGGIRIERALKNVSNSGLGEERRGEERERL